MKKRIMGFVLVFLMCLGLAIPTFAVASQVPVIPSITIPADRLDSGLTITLTNVFDVFVYEGPDAYGGTVTVFFLDVDGTVSFNRDVPGMWGMRFIPDRRGLHPAYGGIEFAARAGEQIYMSEFEGFIWGHALDANNTDHIFDFSTVRTDEMRRNLADRNARIEAQGSTPELGRVSGLAVLETAAIPSDPAHGLSTASAWAHEHIIRAISLNLVPLNLQGAYAQATTRAEFAALVVTLYETITGREIAIDRSIAFNDTTDINVHKAATIGIVTGVGNNNFAPNNTLTREQAAVMLARIAIAVNQPLPQAAPTFADNASISPWAVEAVGQMQAAGIMGGVGNNNFLPNGYYTREQSIVTILRLFDIFD